MFKKMGHPRDSWPFVSRADLIKDVERDVWNGMIFLNQNLHPIAQRMASHSIFLRRRKRTDRYRKYQEEST
jgi:hypothetical protein